MKREMKVLLDMALSVYGTLGQMGYYDGELSLDNLGFVLEGTTARLVLFDYGSLVNGQRVQSDLLGLWLSRVKDDFLSSYQVFKLREFAKASPEVQKIVEEHIRASLDLVDRWMQASTSIIGNR